MLCFWWSEKCWCCLHPYYSCQRSLYIYYIGSRQFFCSLGNFFSLTSALGDETLHSYLFGLFQVRQEFLLTYFSFTYIPTPKANQVNIIGFWLQKQDEIYDSIFDHIVNLTKGELPQRRHYVHWWKLKIDINSSTQHNSSICFCMHTYDILHIHHSGNFYHQRWPDISMY